MSPAGVGGRGRKGSQSRRDAGGAAGRGGTANRGGGRGSTSGAARAGRGTAGGGSGRGAPGAAGARRGRSASVRDQRGGEGNEQVEGRQAVRELLRAGRRRVHSIQLADSSVHSGLLDEVVELAERAGVPVRQVSRERIDAVALTDAPQGVIALADPLAEVELEELCTRAAGRPAPFLVVLDGVTDPHNVGAVMRSALSAGATGMVIGRHRAAPLGPTTTKAAAGAVEWLPVAQVAGIPAALVQLQAAGVWTVGLDAEGTGPLWGLEVAPAPVALVLGAEGSGLSRLTRQRCEVVVSIPMQGPIGSLNVSAAAALGCFEVSRRRQAAED